MLRIPLPTPRSLRGFLLCPKIMQRTSTDSPDATTPRNSRVGGGAAGRTPGKSLWRALRLVLVLAAVAGAASMAWVAVHKIPCRYSCVNGSLLVVAAPISGSLKLAPLEVGQYVTANTIIGSIYNPRSAELEINYHRARAHLMSDIAEIRSIQAKLAQRRLLLARFSKLLGEQQVLDLKYAQSELTRVSRELEESSDAAKFAYDESGRYTSLASMGAVPSSLAQRMETESKRSQAILESKEAQLSQARNRLQAVRHGLQLDSNRTLSFPAVRVDDLQKEISDLTLSASEAQIRMDDDRAELAKSAEQLQLHKSVDLRTPVSGVVWSVDCKSGEVVSAGTAMARILNPADRWVETYVSEQDAPRLHVGGRARVKLPSSAQCGVGATIASVRAGVGRMPASEKVAVMPPTELRRDVQVRLTTKWDRAGAPDSVKFGPQEFFGVGRSVEVSFE